MSRYVENISSWDIYIKRKLGDREGDNNVRCRKTQITKYNRKKLNNKNDPELVGCFDTRPGNEAGLFCSSQTALINIIKTIQRKALCSQISDYMK